MKYNGEWVCWGLNSFKQLEVPADVEFLHIVAGGIHTCGIAINGSLICWGDKSYSSTDAVWLDLTTDEAACGLLRDGSIKCLAPPGHPALDFPTGEEKFIQVGFGQYHGCAITRARQIRCWGRYAIDTSGVVDAKWAMVKSGEIHSCGLDIYGNALCVGNNDFSQSDPPENVWLDVVPIFRTTCGIDTGRSIVCWGDNNVQQANPPAASESWSTIDGKDLFFCGILVDSSLHCWGEMLLGLPQQFVPPNNSVTHFDLRYAHLSRLSMNSESVCGRQHVTGRWLCFFFSGRYQVEVSSEAILAVAADGGIAIVEGERIFFETPEGVSMNFRLPYKADLMLNGGDEYICFASESINGPFPIVCSPFQRSAVELFNPDILGPVIDLAGSHTALCVINVHFDWWCSEGINVPYNNFKAREFEIAEDFSCVLNINGSIACWGSVPEPSHTQLLSWTKELYTAIASKRGLTCAVSISTELNCWGGSDDLQIVSNFTGTGWIDLELSDTTLCASHVGGRLVCVDRTAVDREPLRIDPNQFAFVPAIGVVKSTQAFENCTTQVCHFTSPSLPPHAFSLLLLEDIEITAVPWEGPFVFIGGRLELPVTVTCVTGLATCITVLPWVHSFHMEYVTVKGDSRVFLSVAGRLEVHLVSTNWYREGFETAPMTEIIGGAVFAKLSHWAGQVNHFDAAFVENSTTQYYAGPGGGLVIRGSSRAEFVHCGWEAIHSYGNRSSALVLLADADDFPVLLRLSDCSFKNNTGVHGGALHVEDLSTFSGTAISLLNSTNFISNIAVMGGAMYWLKDSSEEADTATCFRCSVGELPLVATNVLTFENNRAVGGSGGAVYVSGVQFIAGDSSFITNAASRQGGAVVILLGSASFLNTMMVGNTVITMPAVEGAALDDGGGALHASNCDASGVIFSRSVGKGNRAICSGSTRPCSTSGGALFVTTCPIAVENSRFEANEASGVGGAMFLKNVQSDAILSALTLLNNRAWDSGGGVGLVNVSITIVDLACQSNSVEIEEDSGVVFSINSEKGVGGCLATRFDTTLDLTNSMIANNTAYKGGGVAFSCGTHAHLGNVTNGPNHAVQVGGAMFSVCDNPLFSEEFRSANEVHFGGSAAMYAPVVASGSVQLQLHALAKGLFDGFPSLEPAASVGLYDRHGRLSESDNQTVCTIDVQDPENEELHPVLLFENAYTAQGGIVEVFPFGLKMRSEGSRLHFTVRLWPSHEHLCRHPCDNTVSGMERSTCTYVVPKFCGQPDPTSAEPYHPVFFYHECADWKTVCYLQPLCKGDFWRNTISTYGRAGGRVQQ